MHYNTDLFIRAHELVEALVCHVSVDETRDSRELRSLVTSLLPDLQSLLTSPAKSDKSRNDLMTKKITIDDQQFGVNEEFVNTACAVSTDLNLDELVAAQLVFNSGEDAKRLGVSPSQGAIAMFYVRRQYILQLVKFFAGCLSPSSDNFGKLGNMIIQDNADAFITKVLDALHVVEQGLDDVDEKEKQGQFLDLLTDEFVQTMHMRKDFLYMEHDLLGEILDALARSSRVTISGYKKVVNHAKSLSSYNSLSVHCIPFFLTYCRTIEHEETNDDKKLSIATQLYNEIVKTSDHAEPKEGAEKSDSAWNMPYFRAAVEIIVLSVFTSACREAPRAPDIDFKTQIVGPALDAVDDGCFEFFMALAADTSDKHRLQPKYYDYRPILQTRIPEFQIKNPLTEGFRQTLVEGLEYVVDTIICNLADVLKHIRVAEEDTVLSLQHESQTYGDESEDEDRFQLPNIQLETFCAFISYLYSGRSDALKFWSDTDSHLYGFINWASHSHVTFMISAFCDMLASLICDEQSAADIDRFLSAEAALGRARISTRLSWDRILGSLTDYAGRLQVAKKGGLNLNGSHSGPTSVVGAPPSASASSTPTTTGSSSTATISSRVAKKCLATKAQLDPDHEVFTEDECLIISTYLRLVSAVVRYDSATRSRLLASETPDIVVSIFKFLCLPGSSLCGPCLDVLAGFAYTNVKSERHGLWRSVDLWVAYMDPMMRLDHIVANANDVLGFVRLSEALARPLQRKVISHTVKSYLNDADNMQNLPYPLDLGSGYRTPGLVPYCQFVLGDVFRNSVVFPEQERELLQVPCLNFALSCLELIDPEWFTLAATARLPLPLDVDTNHFAVLHSFAAAMSVLFNSKVYNVILDIILADKHDQATVLSLRLLVDIIDRQNMFFELAVSGKEQQQHSQQGSQVQTSPTKPDPSSIVGTSSSATPTLPLFASYGFTRFDESLMFKISIVTQLALNLGSANVEEAYWSCVLLTKISEMPQFSHKVASGRSRFLSAIEAVPDSCRIRDSIMEQIDRDLPLYRGEFIPQDDMYIPDVSELGLYVKYRVLSFLAEGLRQHPTEASYAHYILGFAVTDDELIAADSGRCGVDSSFSVLASVRELFQSSVSQSRGSFIAARIARVSGEIIYLLSQCPLTSVITLDFLRAHKHALELLSIEPNLGLEIPVNIEWQTELLCRRALFLEYLSMEMHHCSVQEATSLLEKYTHAVLGMNVSSRTVPVLDFLNVLVKPISLIADSKPDPQFASQINTDELLRTASYDLPNAGRIIALILAQAKRSSQPASSALQGPTSRAVVVSKDSKETSDPLVEAAETTYDHICESQNLRKERDAQLRCAGAWAKLVLIIIYDGAVPETKKSAFVLESLQRLVPKLSDAAADDVGFAEVYASLIVQLVRASLTNDQGIRSILVDSLFRTCLIATQSPESTSQLRADLYLVCNYLLNKSLLSVVKTLGGRFLEILCSDALTGQDLSRGSSLLLLENMGTLAAKTGSEFLLDQLVKHNLLSLLVESLNVESPTPFTYQTLSVLLQIAQIRGGAGSLIQCNLLDTLDRSAILNVDLDVHAHSSYQRMLVAVLRLIVSILIAMGPENAAVVARVQTFVNTHGLLMQAILKKDVQGAADPDLVQLVVTLTELVRS